MKKLFKCNVCSLVYEGDSAPDICPKCGQPKDQYVELSADATAIVYKSERTNDIHMEIITLSDVIVKLAKEGIDINLDPNCVSILTQARNEAYVMKKGKW